MVRYVIIGAVAVGLAAVAAYYFYTKAQAEKEKAKPPPSPPPPPPPPPSPPPSLKEQISTDKAEYTRGEEIIWFAKNLVVGKTYGVGLWIDNTFTNDPTRDNFVALYEYHSGRHKILDFVPTGQRRFSLFEIIPTIAGTKYNELAYTFVIVK